MEIAKMNSSYLFGEILKHWFLTGIASFIFYFLAYALYNLYLNPLAKYPGPFFAKISGLPNFYYAWTGDRHIWIWQCHQIYGNTIRIAPRSIIVNTPSGYRSIHGSKANIKKSTWYDIYPKSPDNVNTLTTMDKTIHARKRRVINAVISDKSVRSAEKFVIQHTDRFCELLMNNVGKEEWTAPQNLQHPLSYLVFDIFGDLCFGKSWDLKEPGENSLKDMPQLMQYQLSFMNALARSPALGLLIWLRRRFGDSMMPPKASAFFGFIQKNLKERMLLQEKQQASEMKSTREDMFHYLYHVKDPATGRRAYGPEELDMELVLLTVAGTDTTTVTLCGFFFYITRYHKVYQKLTVEIRDTFDSVDEVTTGAKLSSCHYLRACIDESMRMCPPVPSDLARTVLPGGLDIDGEYFPEGTDIGTTSWSMNYSDSYGDPYVFRPERWIVDASNGVTAEDVSRARENFNPFSIGTWNCAGQKLAMMKMTVILARMLYRMEVKRPERNDMGGGSQSLGWGRTDVNQLQLKDGFNAALHGPMLQFKKRILEV